MSLIGTFFLLRKDKLTDRLTRVSDSSMLGNELYGIDQDSVDNTFTDDTTLFNSDLSELKLDKLERGKSVKRESAEAKRRASRTKIDEECGFENHVFMSQHEYLDNRQESEPVRYCSLAQFVEGNDIARKSFKRPTKVTKTETNANRKSVLAEEEPFDKGESGLSLGISLVVP